MLGWRQIRRGHNIVYVKWRIEASEKKHGCISPNPILMTSGLRRMDGNIYAFLVRLLDNAFAGLALSANK